MLPVSRTARQRMIELLSGTRLSAYQLAQMLGISERQVEDHLVHVVKTIARDRKRRFILEPPPVRSAISFFRPHEADETKPLSALPKRKHHRTAMASMDLPEKPLLRLFSICLGDHPSSTRVSVHATRPL